MKLSAETSLKPVPISSRKGVIWNGHSSATTLNRVRPMPFLDALADYQNSDGGFGNAIEPDIRCELSTPIGTTVALQILRDLGDIRQLTCAWAISYCLQSYDCTSALGFQYAADEFPRRMLRGGRLIVITVAGWFRLQPSAQIVWSFVALC